jgi:predicted dehydrogenase
VPAPLRVGLVGYGLAGRVFHGRLIQACPDLSIVTVVTSNPERAAQVTTDLPEARVVPALDALLRDASGLDLVVIATANAVHAEAARDALDADCAVVVDKPLTVTAAQAQDLVAYAGGRPLTVFQNRRSDSDQVTLQRLLAEGRLGPVWRHESRFERFRQVLDTGRWRETLTAEEGGGQLLDLGSHLVDQSVQLFGPVTHVYAEIEHRRGGGDDAVFVALTHAAGVRTHLSLGAVFGSPGPRRRVLGDGGAFLVRGLDSQEDQLRAGVDPQSPAFGMEPEEAWPLIVRGDTAEAEPPDRGRWDSFYPAVAAALRDGKPMPVDPADSIHVLKVIEAARLSAARGTVEIL